MALWEVGLGRQCLVGGVSFELWERRRNLYRRPQLRQSLLSGPLGQSNQATSKPSAELSPLCVCHPPLPSSWSQTCSPATVQHSRWITHLPSKFIYSKHRKKYIAVYLGQLPYKSSPQTQVMSLKVKFKYFALLVIGIYCSSNIKWDEDGEALSC